MTLAEELRKIPVFTDLAAEDLDWLASHMTAIDLAPGDILVREGSPADRMTALLEGEVRLRIEAANSEAAVRVLRAPMLTGMLPYSRMTQFPATGRAVTATRAAIFPAARFPDMLSRIPALGPRLVGLLSDRIRDFTKLQDQHEKLAALGKISAGLAHELNNPAAAARRAVASMRDALATLRDANCRLDEKSLSVEQRASVNKIERELAEHPAPASMDSLERSDCEETIAACLERHGVARAWELAPSLVTAGCEAAWFERVYCQFPAEAWPDILARIAIALSINGLLDEIESSTGRISDLVRAIKEYSHMDQGPEQEVDVHQGLESTLLMLHYRLKHGVTVKLDFDRALPKICAHAGELNQVWTNLIDNAIDAMDGKGELHIRTARELDRLLVEISDNGPGIPPDVQRHLFEPFFTTKGVGQGTGLGLETARRIIEQHGGGIEFQSVPGDTRFQIRLPFVHQSGAAS